MLFDIHAHIIPGVDDGANSYEEALTLLKAARNNGIGAVIATPHFYADMVSFEEYELETESRFNSLKQQADGLPELFRGYEVRYFRGISTSEYTRRLTLNGSEYILVEFPYGEDITDRMLGDIEDIYYNMNITPILAHIERYHKYNGFRNALRLIDDGIAMAHINATSLTDQFKKTAIRLLEAEYVSVIATDMHSADERPPVCDTALKEIEKQMGRSALLRLADNYDRLYNEIVLNKNK